MAPSTNAPPFSSTRALMLLLGGGGGGHVHIDRALCQAGDGLLGGAEGKARGHGGDNDVRLPAHVCGSLLPPGVGLGALGFQLFGKTGVILHGVEADQIFCPFLMQALGNGCGGFAEAHKSNDHSLTPVNSPR